MSGKRITVVTPLPALPNLGCASTEELLKEIAVRMEVTQNSTKGRELAVMCREAIDNLDRGVLNYRTVRP